MTGRLALGMGLTLVLFGQTATSARPAEILLAVDDPTADAQALITPLHIEGIGGMPPAPDFVDITSLTIVSVGDQLQVTFELAGDIPDGEPGIEWLSYGMFMQRDDGVAFQVDVSRDERWRVELTETIWGEEPIETSEFLWSADEWPVRTTRHGRAERSGDRLSFSLPLRRLGPPEELRFFAHSSAVGEELTLRSGPLPNIDDLGLIGEVRWQDAVPDPPGAWMTLDEGLVTPSPLPDPLIEAPAPDDPDAVAPYLPTRIGDAEFEVVELADAHLSGFIDAIPMRELLRPLGKGSGDIRAAWASDGLLDPDTRLQLLAIRVDAVSSDELAVPFLEGLVPGITDDPDVTIEPRQFEGRTIWEMRAQDSDDCGFYALTGDVVVLATSFGCEIPAIDVVAALPDPGPGA